MRLADQVLALQDSLRDERRVSATYRVALAVLLAERGKGTLDEFASNLERLETVARAEINRSFASRAATDDAIKESFKRAEIAAQANKERPQ